MIIHNTFLMGDEEWLARKWQHGYINDHCQPAEEPIAIAGLIIIIT